MLLSVRLSYPASLVAPLRPEDLDLSALPRTPFGHLKAAAVADLLQRGAWDYREALAQNQRLASQVRALTDRVEQLMAQVNSLEQAAARRKDPDELARTLLASAQRAAREERESARQECELMLRKVAQRVERIEQDARDRLEGGLSGLEQLEALRDELSNRLRSTLEAIVTVADSDRDGKGDGP